MNAVDSTEQGGADPDRFQILSLDGGGIRGLFSAGILARWEENLGHRVVDHFDLITGTSTGGIIALGLGLGLRPRELVQFYRDRGPAIFPGGWRKPFRWMRHWRRSKFANAALESGLQDALQNRLLGHSTKRLVIPSFDLGRGWVRVFKTAHHPELVTDHKVPAWQVAMATTAAPTYLPAFPQIDERRLIDGGVWANNPCMVGIVEAVAKLGVPLEKVRVLSIGTTNAVAYPPDALDRGGKLQWAKWAAEVIMQGQSNGATGQAELLLGRDRFLRINPDVPKGLFSLDYADAGKLLAAASHEAMHAEPAVRDRFFGHDAPDFIPCHSTDGSNA